ncbi:hypothetical protein ACFRKB_26510 [Streptomyces scopuliridis]|uniref:hypothetical protein n=1 Tax=Streptomyces scopuliridis TaxID=452529 RepID=UPI0036AD9609
MILLEFDRDSMREPSESQIAKLKSVADWQLRYAYFEMNVTLVVDGFDAEVFRVPVLDFMYCLLLSARDIRDGGEGCVDFTESDVLIEIFPHGSELKVLRSWDAAPGFCGMDEFIAAVSRFAVDGLEFITSEYPTFRDNPTFRKLSQLSSELVR